MLYNVLIVEDDRTMAESLAAQVRVLGHTVAVALGPRIAMQQLNQVIPDLIFLDINMPGVNGLEIVRFLRRDPTTAKVPVIIVSGEEAEPTKRAAFAAGANDYIVKPAMLEDIEASLARVMSTDPSYLRTAQDGMVRNLRDWGIPLGRRFRALKLWFLLRDQGVEGVRARVRRDIAGARWLADQVDATPGWERLAPAPLQTVCLRHVPGTVAQGAGPAKPASGVDEDGLAAHNVAIAESINEGGRFYLTTSDLKGRRVVRVSIGAETTERRHIEALWAALREAAG